MAGGVFPLRRGVVFVILFLFLIRSFSAASAVAMTPGNDYEEALQMLPTYNGYPVIEGCFKYLGVSSPDDIKDRYFYSDGYFKDSAVVYDNHLAAMSLCLAGASMATTEGGTVDYKNKSKNVREMLDHIGCRDICVNADFVVKPGEDTIGVALGRKEINIDGTEYTLIPVGIRGAGYEKEWLGNMKMGTEGDVQGFRTAAERAKNVVDTYIREYGIDTDRVKFWIAGFSRAGAVCDILTHLLTDDYDPSGYHVYGYSFATPRGAYEKTRSYPNSHCTLNRVDAIPCVAPSYMGFSHYGDDTVVEDPDAANTFQAYRIEVSYAVDIGPLTVPESIVLTPVDSDIHSARELVEAFLTALSKTVAPDRATYAGTRIEDEVTLEELFSRILRFIMTTSDEHLNAIAGSIVGFQERLGFSGLFKLSKIRDAVHEGMSSMSAEERDDIYATLWGWFRDSLRDSMTPEEYEETGSMWKALIYVMIEVAHYDYEQSGTEGFTLLGTLIKNLSSIVAAHAPETYFSAVKQGDDFYRDVKNVSRSSVETFRIHDASFVDAVVNKNNSPVARIKSGYTDASKDPLVGTSCLGPDGSDLMPDSEKLLYADRDSDDVRVMCTDPDADYEIELIAGEAPEGLAFAGWVDEKGMYLSREDGLILHVDHGKAYHRFVRPVYLRPEPESEEEPGEGEPESPEGPSERSGSAGWLIGGGAAVALAAGGGGFCLWRRKNRHRRRRK